MEKINNGSINANALEVIAVLPSGVNQSDQNILKKQKREKSTVPSKIDIITTAAKKVLEGIENRIYTVDNLSTE
jgi:Holliday junction resolvasome RuvABC ATP-dependent DNA helicase subunit